MTDKTVKEIDTFNAQGVGVQGDGRIVVITPKRVMTKQEALVHAAWLVCLAVSPGEEPENSFIEVLKAVQST